MTPGGATPAPASQSSLDSPREAEYITPVRADGYDNAGRWPGNALDEE